MHHAWNVKYVPAQASRVVTMCLSVRSGGFDLSINCFSLHVLHSAVQPLSALYLSITALPHCHPVTTAHRVIISSYTLKKTILMG